MAEKTAIQELIEWVQKERENTHKIELFRSKFEQLDRLEELFKSKLPKERQNLIDAHDARFKETMRESNEDGHKITIQSGKEYVKDKFGI